MTDLLSAHTLPVAALIIGHLTQIFMAMVNERKAGRGITLRRYFASRPYGTVLAILGSVSGYLVLADTGQLNAVSAWGMGYAADNMIKTLAARTERDRAV